MNINEAIAEVDETPIDATYVTDTLFRTWCEDHYEPLIESAGCTLAAARVAYCTLSELRCQTYEALSNSYGRPHTTALRSLQEQCNHLAETMPVELHYLRGINQLVHEVIDVLDERADEGGR